MFLSIALHLWHMNAHHSRAGWVWDFSGFPILKGKTSELRLFSRKSQWVSFLWGKYAQRVHWFQAQGSGSQVILHYSQKAQKSSKKLFLSFLFWATDPWFFRNFHQFYVPHHTLWAPLHLIISRNDNFSTRFPSVDSILQLKLRS